MEKQAARIKLKVDVPEGSSETCQGSVRDGSALIRMEEREQGELDKSWAAVSALKSHLNTSTCLLLVRKQQR